MPPATFAGMRAAIEYIAGFEDGYLSERGAIRRSVAKISAESGIALPPQGDDGLVDS
jgi:hypothetical protein